MNKNYITNFTALSFITIILLVLLNCCNSVNSNSNNEKNFTLSKVEFKKLMLGKWEAYSSETPIYHSDFMEHEVKFDTIGGKYIVRFKESSGKLDGEILYPIVNWKVKKSNLISIEYGKVSYKIITQSKALLNLSKEQVFEFSHKTIDKEVDFENDNVLLFNNARFLRKTE